jgi:hypothetical protein
MPIVSGCFLLHVPDATVDVADEAVDVAAETGGTRERALTY